MPDNPATPLVQLFIELWLMAGAYSPSQRSTAKSPADAVIKAITDALAEATAVAAYTALKQLLDSPKPSKPDERGTVLAMMQAIDGIFYRIHPRQAPVASPVSPSPKRPSWLLELRSYRNVYANYGRHNDYCLIPRGPLLSSPRDENAANADSLADRFAALSVVPVQLMHEERPIRVRHKRLGFSKGNGVVAGINPRKESVAFIPIVEHQDHLKIIRHQIADQPFVEFQVASAINPAECLGIALKNVGYADIAIAPELVMPENYAEQIPDQLATFKKPPSRLIIAGSGSTRATDDDGLPWNEARIFNGMGEELWRQRKLWPAGLNQQQAARYGLPDPEKKLIMEYNASGDEIVIVDADGLGRCVVLICQDIHLPLAEELIRKFQPDWVFVPILDLGIAVAGWAHQQAFYLSGFSHARFLIASSTAVTSGKPACGLAVGPKSPVDGEKGRLYQAVSALDKPTPSYATVTWGKDKRKWKQTTVQRPKIKPSTS